ncbi:Zn-dependent exopeptidase [Suhomyces tanzawaensis NRRL Y-17324]|uniref:Peptide hydrolase n=1 Tax=Suhomyces tanzawaensis NRRL Y-17324 TaxID=984487 RepID=A0A1E4SRU3_9ASCO|nr:Zn-dependent exopeptidase [Suhomyces tanzawaensis NRRL Y-17324]ODV82236.1 Zn-dependent exopeptidase [Suhomyces tanzawaensis NRRL Y-17324]
MKLQLAWLIGIAQALPLAIPNDIQTVFELQDLGKLPEIDTVKLQLLITAEGLRERANALYNISLSSVGEYGHPTRVIGSPGHRGTVEYVILELKSLGYEVETQEFEALDSHIESFSLLIDGTKPKSLNALDLTPPTDGLAHGNLVLAKNLGCSEDDYAHVKGGIALIKRGECAFGVKSSNAGKAGAIGAIIYDDEELRGTLGDPTGHEVPTVSVKVSDVEKYIKALTEDPAKKIEASLFVDSYIKVIKTLNVVAETVEGDHDNVVLLGAHSDSVAAGPGINDDGSGTISLLEVARHLKNFKVNNAVRFAWWAAEEEGLLGSEWYANHLSEEENKKLRLFMDYDMMASPNYEYQIYDANNVDHPNGSGDLRDLYIDWYKEKGLNYTFVPFDGRSDYVGFIDNGIPAGGIATGAEGVKTVEGQEKFGGEAGKWFDECYHQLCDDLDNVDYEAWVINTQLIAHSVATYAKDWGTFPKREFESVKVESENSEGSKFLYRGASLIM